RCPKSLIENAPLCILEGYQAFYAEGEYFPGLEEEKGKFLEGQLISLPEDLLDLLISYEDPEDYQLVEREVRIPQLNSTVTASLFLNTRNLILTKRPWSYSEFLKREENLKVFAKIDQWMS
ncbi:MAG: gamma-glutamylcyclotransferase, partial [Halobacteriovoraceae bacterium]|nr:gamma-glutamylcyclotransferase [Halobacteriovoraceae bacterium]